MSELRPTRQAGFLSLWVGLLVSLTLTVAAIAAQRWYGSLTSVRHQEQVVWDRSLAESATHLALAHLNASDSYAGASTDGIAVTVATPSDAPSEASPWMDLAAYEAEDWRRIDLMLPQNRAWQAIAKADYEPYFPALIVAREGIDLQQVSTASYDSAYAGGTDPRGGERDRWGDLIGGSITLRASQPVVIHGHVRPAAGTKLEIDEHVQVTGHRQSLGTPWPLPPLPPRQGGFLPIPADKAVVLPRGHYQTHSLYGMGVGRYVFTGPVQLHVDGNVVLGPSAIVSTKNRPTDLLIYAAGSQVEIHLPFSGGIFAPEADVVLRGTGDFYGAIVARRVRNDGRGRLVFDRALPKWTRGERRMFRLLSLSPLEAGDRRQGDLANP